MYGHPSKELAYPVHKGFTLQLVEEFDAPMDLDRDPIWTWSDGGLGEGQVRFVKEAITFRDGKMRIEMSEKQYPTQNCSNAEVGFIDEKNLTSGELRTRHNMFRYGRYEARIKAPSVQSQKTVIDGNYVSTMFVFRDAKYQHWREIDWEIIGESAYSASTNVLFADNTSAWNEHMSEDKAFTFPMNLRSGFHTYAIEWLPDKITWYFDGHKVREKIDTQDDDVKISAMSAKIMMNLWVFNEKALFGGKKVENNHYPMFSEYDWFRFYRWDKETLYPCGEFDPSCLTEDDMYLTSNNPCDGIPQLGTVYGESPCESVCAG